MVVDLPTPGTPVIPTRWAFPESGSNSNKSCCACSRWSARVDSSSVIARGSAARSPLRTAAVRSLTVSFFWDVIASRLASGVRDRSLWPPSSSSLPSRGLFVSFERGSVRGTGLLTVPEDVKAERRRGAPSPAWTDRVLAPPAKESSWRAASVDNVLQCKHVGECVGSS